MFWINCGFSHAISSHNNNCYEKQMVHILCFFSIRLLLLFPSALQNRYTRLVSNKCVVPSDNTRDMPIRYCDDFENITHRANRSRMSHKTSIYTYFTFASCIIRTPGRIHCIHDLIIISTYFTIINILYSNAKQYSVRILESTICNIKRIIIFSNLHLKHFHVNLSIKL